MHRGWLDNLFFRRLDDLVNLSTDKIQCIGIITEGKVKMVHLHLVLSMKQSRSFRRSFSSNCPPNRAPAAADRPRPRAFSYYFHDQEKGTFSLCGTRRHYSIWLKSSWATSLTECECVWSQQASITVLLLLLLLPLPLMLHYIMQFGDKSVFIDCRSPRYSART